MPTLPQSEHAALIAKMNEEMRPVFQQSVVAIYAEKDNAPIQCGTGTLFRVAGMSFLVTAAHVSDLFQVHKIRLFITDMAQGTELVPIAGRLHTESTFDVAVWELSPQVVKNLPNRKFLTVQHADRSCSRDGKGWYYVHGYPSCWSKTDSDRSTVTVKPFTYGCLPYDGPTNTFKDYDLKVHVLFSVLKDQNVGSDGDAADLPEHLGGISGCSMWQAYYEGLPSDDWEPDDARIVAVQTGVFKKGTVVCGTSWWVVNQILLKVYPELKAPLDIVTPSKRGRN